MNKEKIEELALETYPITPAYDGDEMIHDINCELREGFIKGLEKASELLYTEEQLKSSLIFSLDRNRSIETIISMVNEDKNQ
jgi:hypothetical protein